MPNQTVSNNDAAFLNNNIAAQSEQQSRLDSHQQLHQLEPAFRDILDKRGTTSGLSFGKLYNCAFRIVLNKHEQMLADKIRRLLVDNIRDRIRPTVLLLNNMQLRAIVDAFHSYRNSAIIIRDIVMYMERISVESDRQMPSIFDSALALFRQHVVDDGSVVGTKLSSILLDLVAREREQADAVDSALVKAACDMLFQMGAYETIFERSFIEQSEKVFRQLADNRILNRSASAYIGAMHRLLDAEPDRCRRFLHASSCARIKAAVRRVFIDERFQQVLSIDGDGGAPAMLQWGQFDRLRQVYEYAQETRNDAGLETLVRVVGEDVRRRGEILFQDGSGGPIDLERANQLVELKDRCDQALARGCFGDSTLFRKRFADDVEAVLNQSQDGRPAAEALSVYIGGHLQNDADIDKAMALFRLLENKDTFSSFFHHHLQRRLLGGRSSEPSAEQVVIDKLRVECGTSYTAKFEQMLRDIERSRALGVEYNAQLGAIPGVSFDARILKTTVWPMPTPTSTPEMPPEAASALTAFREFYDKQHPNRRLHVVSGRGNAELQTTTLFGEKKYILQVSTQQMIILMLFNDADEWSYSDMLEHTRLPELDLTRTLRSLSACGNEKLRLLVVVGPSDPDSDEKIYGINKKFASRSTRVKIPRLPAPSKRDEDDRRSALAAVEKARGFEIDAVLVRLMKTRREMPHASLVGDACQQLSARFQASPAVVKKRIDSLIDRDFLVRVPGDLRLLQYVA